MNVCYMHTPIGYLKICESEGLITEITYCGSCPEVDCGSSTVLEKAKKQLQEYFDGSRKVFDLPLDITGSPFTVSVLNTLAQVPYGQTVSYGQLAQAVGRPGAARAVGTVMRKNKFVIVLPCHRVLQGGNKLGNYSAGGPANKDWLLTFEKQNL